MKKKSEEQPGKDLRKHEAGLSGKMGKRSSPEPLELSLFCHQVSLVLKSGIHPIEGIPLIADQMVHPQLRQALVVAGEAVLNGKPLHEALHSTGFFPEYLVSMTRLGESAGMLESVMENLSAFYEREDRFARRIRGAVAYPLVLLILMLGVIVLLVAQVLPMFAKILVSLGGDMPQATRILLGVGAFFSRSGIFVLPALAILLTGFALWIRTDKGRLHWDGMKLRFPFFGRLLVKTAAARFSSGLSVVLHSGMELQEGLEQVRELPDNRRVREMLRKVTDSVGRGEDLGTALAAVSLFPPLFTRMIQIGHRTGELDRMMSKLSSVYEGEVENSIQQLTNSIEPVLVIILSAVVGVILLAVMLPLINIMGAIG